MPNFRGFVVAGFAGALGAVLVAVLVLGRSEADAPVTPADLDEGGVLMTRTEIYQRHGAKAEQLARLLVSGDTGIYPERRVDETWVLLAEEGEIIEAAAVSWTDDGALLQCIRVTVDGTVAERPALGVREEEPPRSGSPGALRVPPSQLLVQAQAGLDAQIASDDWSEVPAPPGSIQLENRRPIGPGELISPDSSGYSVPYFGDLEAVEMVILLTYRVGDFAGGEERFVELADGSRVLVESRWTTLEARTAAEWDAFVARVWAD